MKTKIISKRMLIAGMIISSIAFVLAFNGGFGTLGIGQAMLNSPLDKNLDIIRIIYWVVFIFGCVILPVGFVICFVGKARLTKLERESTFEVVYLA